MVGIQIPNLNMGKDIVDWTNQKEMEFNLNLNNSYVIGDRWRDIQTAKNIGLTSILIKYDYDEKKINADFECNNLEEAANYILKIY